MDIPNAVRHLCRCQFIYLSAFSSHFCISSNAHIYRNQTCTFLKRCSVYNVSGVILFGLLFVRDVKCNTTSKTYLFCILLKRNTVSTFSRVRLVFTIYAIPPFYRFVLHLECRDLSTSTTWQERALYRFAPFSTRWLFISRTSKLFFSSFSSKVIKDTLVRLQWHIFSCKAPREVGKAVVVGISFKIKKAA